eukprot:gene4937-9854_t
MDYNPFGFQEPSTAEQNALDLYYSACDEKDYSRKISKAIEAIRVYPNCVEALGLLAHCFRSAPENIRDYVQALHYADKAKSIGSIRENTSMINGVLEYGHIENRPYLRALAERIFILEKMGREADAINETEHILRICPERFTSLRLSLVSKLFLTDEYLSVENHCHIDLEWGGFPYSKLLLSYYKHSKNDLSGDELIQSLIHALQGDKYVPMVLLGDIPIPITIPEDEPQYSSAEYIDNAQTYGGYFKGKAIWQHVPGALSWLQFMTMLGGKVPDELSLIKILAYESIIIKVYKNNSILYMYCTKCKEKMIGCGLKTFKLPDRFNESHVPGQPITVFETTPGWKNNGFKTIDYNDIVEVQFWQVILNKIKKEHTVISCPLWKCENCHIEQPYHPKKQKQIRKKTKKNSKLEVCRACSLMRFNNKLCEICHTANDVKLCTACKGIFYCSTEHQKQDWKLHKVLCKQRIAKQSPLVDVIISDLGSLIMKFLLGECVTERHSNVVISTVHLSRTNKAIREKMMNINIWKYLQFQVNLSESDQQPYGRFPDRIISTYIRYGAKNIIALRLCLKHINDNALADISQHCRNLTRFSLRFTSITTCKFVSTHGLCQFFSTVSELTHIELMSDQPPGYRLKYHVHTDVLQSIANRRFPLKALTSH